MKDRLNRSLVYRGFKSVLYDNFGANTAEIIWYKANAKLAFLEKEYPDITGDSKMMVLPAAALYSVLCNYSPENALSMLKKYGTYIGSRIAAIMHGITSVPGASKLIWKKAPALMRKNSSPEKGYTRNIISETSELVAVDILSCPLHDTAVRIGIPEAAQVVCAMDKAYMDGFKHIRYTRTTSVAEGGSCCDYRLSYDETKE